VTTTRSKNDDSLITTITGTAGTDLFTVADSSNISIVGLEGNDTVTSTIAVDKIVVEGDEGNDQFNLDAISNSTLSGDAGNDDINLTKTASNLRINAGAGVDTVDFTGANKVVTGNTILGRSGADTFVTAATTDVTTSYFGGDLDNDVITFNGEVASSTIRGGKQDDTLTFNDKVSSSIIRGDSDVDTITIADGATTTKTYIGGDAGNDTIDINENATSSTIRGGKGADIITYDADVAIGTVTAAALIKGDDGKDVIDVGQATATDGLHTIYGGLGDDTITTDVDATKGVLVYGDKDESSGGGGKDGITTGAGADTIYGGSGKDTIDGINGKNLIKGGADADNITGGAASDTIYGGAGNDTISAEAGADFIKGDGGNDVIAFTAANATEALLAVDTVDGGADTDTFEVNTFTTVGTTTIGDNTFGLLSNFETLKFNGTNANGVDSAATLGTKAQAAGITTFDARSLDGTSSEHNTVTSTYTSTQAVTIYGSDDVQIDDSLTGGAGNDTIDSGSNGEDTLAGGAGNDTFIVDSATASNITDLGGSDVLTIGLAAATLTGIVTADFTAGAGSANNSTTNAALTLDGTADVLSVTNATGTQGFTLNGDGAVATASTMTGSSRADIFQGNGGIDSLTGGLGADTFIFTNAQSQDIVSDFSGTAGQVDLINVDDTALNTSGVAATGIGVVVGQATVLSNLNSTAFTAGDTVTFVDHAAAARLDLEGTTANVLNMTKAGGYASAAAVATELMGANGLTAGAGGKVLVEHDTLLVQYMDSDDNKFALAVMYVDDEITADANIAAGDITGYEIAKFGTTALTAADIVIV
jgi:Ca2+-binding RTX toxin-like protein